MSATTAFAPGFATSRKGRGFRLVGMVDAFFAAQRTAVALEANRRPADADLATLGIAPGAFDRAR